MSRLKELKNERILLNGIDDVGYDLFTEEQINELLNTYDREKAEAANFILASIEEPKLYCYDAV